MRILYITSLFGIKSSSASIRNYGCINGLAELIGKENIDILTVKRPEFLYDQYLLENTKVNRIIYDEIKAINRFLKQKTNKIETSKKIVGNEVLKNIKNKIRDYIFFPSVEKEWIRSYSKLNFQSYDLIITSSDSKTSHLVGMKIKNENPKIKWVTIWGDPWSTDITLDFITKMRGGFWEKRILERADCNFYVSEPTTKEMKRKYTAITQKIKYIPRGYAEEINISSEYNRKKSEDINLVYTGALNLGRNIDYLIKAVVKINEETDYHLNVEFYGNTSLEIKEEYKKNSCVKFNEGVSFGEIKGIYKESDILIYIGNAAGTTQIPGKLYDYFGTNKKILAIVNSEDAITEFIKQTERTTVSKNNIEDIEKGILEIIKNMKVKEKPYSSFSCKNSMGNLLEHIKGE